MLLIRRQGLGAAVGLHRGDNDVRGLLGHSRRLQVSSLTASARRRLHLLPYKEARAQGSVITIRETSGPSPRHSLSLRLFSVKFVRDSTIILDVAVGKRFTYIWLAFEIGHDLE